MKLHVKWVKHPRDWKEEDIDIDPEKTAFLIIDAQNEFCKEGGATPTRWGASYVAAVRPTIEANRRVADACREIGIKVILTQHQYHKDLSDWNTSYRRQYARDGELGLPGKVLPGTPIGVKGGTRIEGTWNTAIVDELTPKPGDIVVAKRVYSAFYQTELELILETLRVDTLMFGGYTTAICVEGSLRDAFYRGFRVILLSDCAAEVADEIHNATLENVGRFFGYITTSEEVVKATKRT